jgi:hypothetical protein
MNAPVPLRAATIAGRLAAQGLLDPSESLPALLLAARTPPACPAPQVLAAFEAARLATDAARRRAAARVRAALPRLLAARAARPALLAAAAAADPACDLLAHERQAIAASLIAHALRGQG